MNTESQSHLPSAGLSAADRIRLEYDALTRQLERMRAMQYAYNRKFFALLLISTLVSLGLIFWGKWMGQLVVCFGLVTTGVTASFFLHFCDFARVHARAIEARINALLGARVLIASELEAEYFYPHASAKVSGFSLERPWSFFSVYTLHFCGVWGALVLWCAADLWDELSTGRSLFWALLWAGWCGGNVSYLRWWFMDSGAEARMARQLAEAYGPTPDPAPPVMPRQG
jgi:hypothetical protein